MIDEYLLGSRSKYHNNQNNHNYNHQAANDTAIVGKNTNINGVGGGQPKDSTSFGVEEDGSAENNN